MENSRYNFKNLFVLDLANNHQGDVQHGLAIIRENAKVASAQGVRCGVKFQFRQLDSFIHPDHQKDSDNKHIPRFLSTRMDPKQYQQLLDEVKAHKLISICTPFDEESVDIIVEMGFDILKIASCSAKDWPLLEKAVESGLPIIVSTGGLTIHEIDDVVSFFDHRGADFAIMHCVSIYPTPDADCNLRNISMLKERFPNRVIGWSTHEAPSDTGPVMVAVGQGAEMFERHVGIETDKIKLNKYSSTPKQVEAWFKACKKAQVLAGSYERTEPTKAEKEALDSLRRGIFAKKDLEAGTLLEREDVFFAMPYVPGQLSSENWRPGMTLQQNLKVNEAVFPAQVEMPPAPKYQVIKSAIHQVKALLNEARVHLGPEFEVEYSHHEGIENFMKVGTVLINCINREYCKKILVQLPGQVHPEHFHKRKEETFQVLYGELHSNVDGRTRIMRPGDTALVMPGVWHNFWSETGCVFEEVSTTHFNNDSVYRDPAINKLERLERKSIVNHWGRYELN
ncbi:cupin domain-containing protein [Thalassospira sp. HF15]|uniref:N-acetylneuraminate synthase family protein n=1 Tax=Thalassospira sp. HF15 TaxID=2722755 RepID=UPI00142F970F|nr:N-acetylneuraminate synthase family protein [Thalassospira sp. HF15]NIY75426.1 cupin domain-containing protein [Thalassospira sp. HF15]